MTGISPAGCIGPGLLARLLPADSSFFDADHALHSHGVDRRAYPLAVLYRLLSLEYRADRSDVEAVEPSGYAQ